MPSPPPSSYRDIMVARYAMSIACYYDRLILPGSMGIKTLVVVGTEGWGGQRDFSSVLMPRARSLRGVVPSVGGLRHHDTVVARYASVIPS
jgi:hypothetical protein